MPLINLTQDDLNRARQADAGWHKMKLVEVNEKASKDKQSINWNFDFEISDGANAGRHVFTNCNSKAVGMTLIPLASALLDIPIDEVQPAQINTDAWIGKECWGEVEDDTYEGRIVKRLNNFSPASKPPF